MIAGRKGGYDCMRCEVLRGLEIKLKTWSLAQRTVMTVYEPWW